MTEKCWYNLDIDMTEVFRPDWKWPDVTGSDYGIWLYPKISKLVTQKWLSMIRSKGLNVQACMLFFRGKRFQRTTAHVDIYSVSDDDKTIKIAPLGLNWIIGGSDSFMTWYEPSKHPIKISYSDAKTPYADWPISSLKESDRCNIKNKLTLVRTDVPHNIEMGDDPRWCVSFRLADKDNYTWDSTVSMLRDKKLLVER